MEIIVCMISHSTINKYILICIHFNSFAENPVSPAVVFRQSTDGRTDMNTSTTSSGGHVQLSDLPKSQSVDADASIHDSDLENRHRYAIHLQMQSHT